MKKIIYGILIFSFMFFGVDSVRAEGEYDENISISPTSLNIPVGGTANFTLKIADALVFADISADKDVVAISLINPDTNHAFVDGRFSSSSDLYGGEYEYVFSVAAVGDVGSTTTIVIDNIDAAIYADGGEEVTGLTFSIPVRIVDAGAGKNVTITYDANEGKDAPSTQTIVENGKLTSVKPKRDGYEFIGWNTKADGSGTSYSAGGVYTGSSNVTLYAQWKAVGNVGSNPQTADSTMIIFIAIIVTFGGYAYWYTKKTKEN